VTYPVDASGNIGSLIDSWQFEDFYLGCSNYHPSVVKVSGDVYAVAHRKQANRLSIHTMTIATNGTITKTAIDTESISIAMPDILGGFIKKPGTTKYIAFWEGTDDDGFMAVINIDDDGTNIALTDSWEFDTTEGGKPVIVHISGHVFAIAYNDGTSRIIKTFQVADDGTITKSFIDTETFGSSNIYYHYIIHVSGSVYAVFSDSTSEVKTFTISAAGVITAIDTGTFYTAAGAEFSPCKIKEARGTSYFVYSIRTGIPDWYGRAVTLPISSSGTIGNVITSATLSAGLWAEGQVPVEVRTGIFVFPWIDTPGADGHIVTVRIDVPSLYPSDTMARVSSIRHICRPGFYRMQVGLGDLGFDIDVAEATVRKALDTAEEPPTAPIPPYEPGPYGKPTPTEPTAMEKLADAARRQREQQEDLFPASARVTAPQPPLPRVRTEPSIWQRLTPWKEEAGETFGSQLLKSAKEGEFGIIGSWIGRLFK